MLAGDGRSAFAVPIPDTVDVDTLTFVRGDGSVIAIVDVPDIPVGYGADLSASSHVADQTHNF